MTDKFVNPPSKTNMCIAEPATCMCTFSSCFKRASWTRVAELHHVLLQLLIIFTCSAFPRRQLLLVRDGRAFFLFCSCRIPAPRHRGSCPVWVTSSSVNVCV